MNNATFKRYVNAIVSGTIAPVVDVVIEPAHPEAPLAPVVEVVLSRPVHDVEIRCADCRLSFWKGEFDCDDYCDDCRASRDAWADALEIRMAKAAIPADVKKGAA